MKIISVVGARPNFMKIAPLAHAMRRVNGIEHVIVHTGQHYDEKMSGSFFKQLGIPRPKINLEVGSGSHAKQTAEVMARFETILLKHKPDLVIVVGDVNSTMACTIVAKKLWIPVAHVEAGLRSFDRKMPEEINRLVTDCICDIWFTTSPEAKKHLMKEGVPSSRIFFVGNVMIDTLFANRKTAEQSDALRRFKVYKRNYVLVTLHRPSNVDSRESLLKIMKALKIIQKKLPVIFPVHPRTHTNIKKFLSKRELGEFSSVAFSEPLGYFDFLNLMQYAKVVLTDSGGIQEETTALGVACLTLRKNTERPITITQGTNILVGTDTKRIIREAEKVINGKTKKGRCPKYWDGRASERIVKTIQLLNRKGKLSL